MKNFIKIAVGIVFAGIPFVAMQSWAQQPEPLAKHSSQEVMIGPDDALDIIAIDLDKVSKQYRVGKSGDLNLPMPLGRIHAAGKTVGELEAELTPLAGKYVKEPHVSVHLVELRSQPVTVEGSVDKPGVYQIAQIAGKKTIYDVLLMAGGPIKGAGQTVTIRRNSERGAFDIPGVKQYADGENNSIDLDLVEVMSSRGEQANLEILPHDTILVSAAKLPRYVQITGEVLRPGAVELVTKDAVSLSLVVAIAGGTTPLASKGNTLIWHINEDGVRSGQGIVIDLKKIETGEALDLSLTAGRYRLRSKKRSKSAADDCD